MKLFPIAFSLLALASIAASAQETRYSIAVPYGDLNLRSEAGLKVLDKRLELAIRTVCHRYNGSVIPEYRFAVAHCLTDKQAEVAALRDRAVADFNVREARATP